MMCFFARNNYNWFRHIGKHLFRCSIEIIVVRLASKALRFACGLLDPIQAAHNKDYSRQRLKKLFVFVQIGVSKVVYAYCSLCNTFCIFWSQTHIESSVLVKECVHLTQRHWDCILVLCESRQVYGYKSL